MSKEKLNNNILETISNIQENYPELSKFIDEMTITLPIIEKPEIDKGTLQEYQDSLQQMVTKYAKHTKKHIVIIGAGFAGLKLARKLNNNPNYTITLIDKINYPIA